MALAPKTKRILFITAVSLLFLALLVIGTALAIALLLFVGLFFFHKAYLMPLWYRFRGKEPEAEEAEPQAGIETARVFEAEYEIIEEKRKK